MNAALPEIFGAAIGAILSIIGAILIFRAETKQRKNEANIFAGQAIEKQRKGLRLILGQVQDRLDYNKKRLELEISEENKAYVAEEYYDLQIRLAPEIAVFLTNFESYSPEEYSNASKIKAAIEDIDQLVISLAKKSAESQRADITGRIKALNNTARAKVEELIQQIEKGS